MSNVQLFPLATRFKELGKIVNKVWISVINCHSVKTFKTEGFCFVFKYFCYIYLQKHHLEKCGNKSAECSTEKCS